MYVLEGRTRRTFVDDVEISFIFEDLNHFGKRSRFLTQLHVFILQYFIPCQLILDSFE